MGDTGRHVGGRPDAPRPRRNGWPVNGPEGPEGTPEGADGFEGGWFDKPVELGQRPRPNGHVNGNRVDGNPVNGNPVNGNRVNGDHVHGTGQRPAMPPPTRQIPRPQPSRPDARFHQELFQNAHTDPGPFSRVSFEPRAPEPGPRISTPIPTPPPDDPVDERDEWDEPESTGKPFRTKAETKRKRKVPFWIELPVLVVVALLFTFVIQTFVARVYVIPSGSMELTLNGNNGTGDRIVVDKVVYDLHGPRPGDVVVFKGPPGWDQTEFFPDTASNPVVKWLRGLAADIGVAKPDEYDLVKRVIAVGGQTVSCCDKQNRAMVDGKPLDEPYVYWQPGRPGPAQQLRFGPIKVPQGYLWVEGDNRSNSDDSRYQNGGGIRGIVPVANVIGKARGIIWPPSRWRGVTDHDPQTVALGQPSWPGQLATTGVGALAALPTLWLGRRFRPKLLDGLRRSD
jgi:signal peptidase I